MDQGQERFYNFILERVMEDKKAEAKAILEDNFKKQAEGSFTREDAVGTAQNLIPLLKPEYTEEVLSVMKQFSQNMR